MSLNPNTDKGSVWDRIKRPFRRLVLWFKYYRPGRWEHWYDEDNKKKRS